MPPPIRITLLEQRERTPTWKYQYLRVTLMNRRSHPVWFLLPSFTHEPLASNGIFLLDKDWKYRPFGGSEYGGEGGSAVKVSMYGGSGFEAFRLPSHGEVTLEGYCMQGSVFLKETVIFKVSQLKVNGRTQLESWLPYGTISGKMVKVSKMCFASNGKA